jgi:hypothetical protein
MTTSTVERGDARPAEEDICRIREWFTDLGLMLADEGGRTAGGTCRSPPAGAGKTKAAGL